MMFRVVVVPAAKIKGRYNGSCSRLYRALRHYSKEQKSGDLCPPEPPKKPKTGTALTFGALALFCGGAIGYAKYDPNFRCYLTEYLPFTDGVIKFVFQEDKSYSESIKGIVSSIKGSEDAKKIAIQKKQAEIKSAAGEYKTPPPVFPGVAKELKESEPLYSEVRIESKGKSGSGVKVEIVDPKPQAQAIPDTHPKSLVDLELKIKDKAAEVISAYNIAIEALQSYNEDVETLIEGSFEKVDAHVWNSLKQKSAEKTDAVNKAEREAEIALHDLAKMKDLLKKTDFPDITDVIRGQAQRDVDKLTHDINDAKKKLELEIKVSEIAEKYWTRVEASRQHFSEELEILFPNMNIRSKKWNISEGDLDLFILHSFSKVAYYQNQLHKLETIGSEKLKRAVDAARRGGLEVLTTEQVCQALEKERIKLETDFMNKCLRIREETERNYRKQLKLQSEAFADHLTDALKVHEAEIEKDLTRTFDEKLTEERCKYKTQLAAMIGRLHGLDSALRARAESEETSRQSQILWSACQALYKSLKVGCPGLPWKEQLRPLDPEITAVHKAAGRGDELVQTVLSSIPTLAQTRGIFPEDALRERFLKVEKVARSVSLVPEGGARLHMYLLSFLQSFLILKAANPIPQSELNDEKTNFSKLSTNDILQRARYWLDRGDFAQTLRYMNLLKGAPRAVARQWMDETRILLETQQAASTLMAHAAANGLLYL